MNSTLNLVVFISGRGSNLKNIIDAIESGKLNAKIQCVLSNKETAYGLTIAREKNIPTIIISPMQKLPRDLDNPLRIEYDMQIYNTIKNYPIDFICLAGFMHILGKEFLNLWVNRVINIHPSLLPSFKGAHAQRDAWQAGVKIIGATIHYVIPEIDAGKIICQGAISAENYSAEEEFAAQILKVEHYLYPYALSKLCNNSLNHQNQIYNQALQENIIIS